MWRRSDELIAADLFLSPSNNVLSVSRRMMDSGLPKERPGKVGSRTRQIKARLRPDGRLSGVGAACARVAKTGRAHFVRITVRSRPGDPETTGFELRTPRRPSEEAVFSFWLERSTGRCPQRRSWSSGALGSLRRRSRGGRGQSRFSAVPKQQPRVGGCVL